MLTNVILYPDTEKELFLETDYKAIPQLESLNCTEIETLLDNVFAAYGNACINGAALLEMALCNDIIAINKKRFADYLRFVSPGHIATIINDSRYTEIDKALLAAWKWYNNTDNFDFVLLETDPANIEQAVLKAYQEDKQQERQVY